MKNHKYGVEMQPILQIKDTFEKGRHIADAHAFKRPRSFSYNNNI